ncbi:hypothetical protein AB0J80_22500 [Actinoplanes sp. NPDC049548]|uniref:hypothetical protein n=1 Tax=Actinoplanes sp. NPDC049548 TaxID=3155152 RepID=UPI00341CA4E4
MMPVFYARPEGEGVPLDMDSALASFATAGSPRQIRSDAFTGAVDMAIAEDLREIPDPLALRVNIALPGTTPLLRLHHLDNYVFPLIPRLTAGTRRQFASVWATKRHATKHSVAVCQARGIRDPGATYSFQARTTASAISPDYKKQIRRQLTADRPLPDGGIALQLSFVVGRRRAWPNLWKTTIDALGAIIGHDASNSEGSVHDGRITDLGLHCRVDPATGSDVIIAIRAQADNQLTTA